MAPPRLTLITPVLNQASRIAETLDSVTLQGYPIEHIVIDGGSTDGTVAVLKRTPNIHWISEPDKGLYDAVNKGIRMATGDIIGHLNSGDILLPGALAAVSEGFARDRLAEAACGGAQLVRLRPEGPSRLIKTWRSERSKRLDWHTVTLGNPIINARFFRRSWYRRAGFYDARHRLAADRDFLIRSMILGLRTIPLERVIYQYRLRPDPETRRKSPPYDDYRSLARTWIIRSDGPEELRRMACRWFAVETVRQLTTLGRNKAWRDFRDTFLDARDFLPGWPAWFLREGIHQGTGGLL